MTELRLSVPWMFITGLMKGKISILFYETEELHGAKKGDLVELYWDDANSIKLYLKEAKPIVFRDVTDKIAKKSGFATKELLSYYLMQKYNITSYRMTPEAHIPDRLFYMIEFIDDPENIEYSDGETIRNTTKVPNVNTVFYPYQVMNSEYETKL